MKNVGKGRASNAADPKRQDTKLKNSNKKDCSIVAQQQVSNTNSLLVRVGRITCSSALRSIDAENVRHPLHVPPSSGNENITEDLYVLRRHRSRRK